MEAPVIAVRRYAAGRFGYRVPMILEARAGLHYIRGNAEPYFAVSAEGHRAGFPEHCQMHWSGEGVVEHFPRLADLGALHLAGMSGEPVHAEANGWYWLAGYLGGMGETYHGGNAHGGHDCLAMFARYIRVEESVATRIADDIRSSDDPRGAWATKCNDMRPRWAEEAAAVRSKYRLGVFGDTWEG